MLYYSVCDSTNEIVMQKLADSSLQEGSLIFADYQTRGRGQRHASWESTAGMNLTFTVALFPDLPVHLQFYLNMVAALAITDCLDTHLQYDQLKVKWPNDIYFAQSKICGILIQNNLKLNKIQSCALGIGLNVNQTHFQYEGAASLKMLTGQALDRKKLLSRLARRLEERYFQLKRQQFTILKQAYLDRLYWKNELHTFQDDRGPFQGVIIGIDEIGRLQIEEQEKIRAYSLKEVTFLN